MHAIVEKSKDIGMGVRKGSGVIRSYLVRLLFGDSIPICLFIFLNVFL